MIDLSLSDCRLIGAPQHNGRKGTVAEYDAAKKRYAVMLPPCFKDEDGPAAGGWLKAQKPRPKPPIW